MRYADDFVVGLQYREDGDRLMAMLERRLGKFGLKLHPTKTRLREFGRFAKVNRARRGDRKPETFNFLGMTHVCGRTRKGTFALQRFPARERLRGFVERIKEWLRENLHSPIPHQGLRLRSAFRGYLQYHAVPGTCRRLQALRNVITSVWISSLRRRSQRHKVTWQRMSKLAARWLPAVRICHPYPDRRFAF